MGGADLRFGAAVAALAGVLFGCLAASTLTGLDAGELGAAAWELGIAHPPGFPVFSQTHGLIMHGLPLGDAAFRGALGSGFVAAVTVGFLALVARLRGARPWAAALGALSVAVCSVFALHATSIEVYSGVACFLAVGLWLALRWHQSGDGRFALALGLLVGLAGGHHSELRLVALLLVPVAVVQLRRKRKLLVYAFGFAVLGLLCVAYLPLRSAADPWRDWGNPETVVNFWHHLWGHNIRLAYAHQVGHFRWADGWLFLQQLWGANSAVLVLGLGGLVYGLRRPLGWAIALIWVIDLLYATSINPMGLRDLQNGVVGLCCLGLGVAVAVEGLSQIHLQLGPLLATTAIVLGISPTLLDLPGDGVVRAVLDAAADDAPPETLALVASDTLSAAFAWGQVVEGLRPDVAVVVRQHAGRASSVGPVARRLPATLAGWRGSETTHHPGSTPPAAQPGAPLADLVHLRDGWPVRWEWARGLDSEAAPPGLQPAFPWFAHPAPPDGGRALAALLALLERLPLLSDPQSLRILAGLAIDWGRWAQRRDPVLAVRAFSVALGLDDSDRSVVRELARMEVNFSQHASARGRLDRLLEVEPQDAEALGLRGVLRANTGDLVGAAADWRAALAEDAQQPEARVGLEQLRRMQEGARKRQ